MFGDEGFKYILYVTNKTKINQICYNLCNKLIELRIEKRNCANNYNIQP